MATKNSGLDPGCLSRRAILKGLMGVAAGAAMPLAAHASLQSGAAARKSGTGLPPETQPEPSLDPRKNASWEGWDNPRLGPTNGWSDTSASAAWTTILNPDGLAIYHDRFYRIPESHPKHHWVMVMDTRKCVGCQACVVSCKSENNVPLGVYRTWVDVYQTGDTVPDPEGDVVLDGRHYRMDAKVVNMPKICNHCAHPPCVEVCPVKATFKRQDGIVMVDPRLCIGCGTCVNACPYDARFINPVSQVADKCTFCVERVDAGLLPACVTSCVGRARVFGDILDPNSEVSRLLARYPHSVRHPEFGTDPQVFYIGESGDISTDPDPNVQHMVFTYTSNANSNVAGGVEVI